MMMNWEMVAVAQDRNPDADIRVGDMHALPWEDASFDVATSFRGIWGTTPAAVDEIHRVLVPIQNVGETDFLEAATQQAGQLVRDGLPLRAQIAVVGYLARKPAQQKAGQ